MPISMTSKLVIRAYVHHNIWQVNSSFAPKWLIMQVQHNDRGSQSWPHCVLQTHFGGEEEVERSTFI